MLNVGDILRLCPPDLSKGEREAITKVLYKNLMLLDDHRKQLLPLRTEIHGLKEASTIVANVDYTKTCMRCRSSLPTIFSAGRCLRCKQVICAKCRVNFQHKSGGSYWLCSLCAKQRIFDVHSGDWISRFFSKTNPFGTSYSLTSNHSSSESYTSLSNAAGGGMGQARQNRFKSPTSPIRAISSVSSVSSLPYFRSEPHLDSNAMAPPQNRQITRLRGEGSSSVKNSSVKSSMSPINSTHSSRDQLDKDPQMHLDSRNIARSSVDVRARSNTLTANPVSRKGGFEDVFVAEQNDFFDGPSFDAANVANLSVSQPNLFIDDNNCRNRRQVRRRPSNSSGVIGKTIRHFSQSNSELNLAKRISAEEASNPAREIAVQSRITAFYDGRAKGGGGVLRLIFEDCALVSVIDVATSQICQFMACFLPRENAGLYYTKSAQLSRKNDRLGLEMLLPVFTDDTSELTVHISIWLLKPNFLGTGPAANDGRSNVKRALLGEASYAFNELMKLGSGERLVPLYRSVLEFPSVHASGNITFTLTLHSARAINQQVTSRSLQHKMTSRRTLDCDHLCIELKNITSLLLPDGLKKFQIYCKARLLPIKTDQVKTKTFQLADEKDKKFHYDIQRGGIISLIQWPESYRQICVADMLGSHLAGGRCLELLIVNRSRSGSLLPSGSAIKTVLGCIRLGSNASFDSTIAEAAVWTSVIEHPDVPLTATLPMRPNESCLLNIM